MRARRSVWILTMMQSCASAAKLRAAGPFSPSASVCHVCCRFPPPRIVNSAVRPEPSASAEIGKKILFPEAFSACRMQNDALQCLASRDKTPEGDQELACQRDDHRLARAQTAIGSAGARAGLLAL